MSASGLAEQLRVPGIGLEFLTGELQGGHGRSGVVFTVLAVLSGMEREYIHRFYLGRQPGSSPAAAVGQRRLRSARPARRSFTRMGC
jgi:hypothetical protein